MPIRIELTPSKEFHASWLVIQNTSCIGLSDSEGNLQIENIPAGDWSFRAWHPKYGFLKKVLVDGEFTTWSSGLFHTVISEGTRNLGTIQIK